MTDRKKILAGAGILLGLFAGVQGVSGYQTAYDQAKNVIVPGNNDTEIKEEFPTPTPIDTDEDADIPKKIWVANNPSGTNNTSVNCYVRVAVGYSDNDIGKAVSMKNRDTVNWIDGGDGFYYYTKRLKEGESTTALCSGFTVSHKKLETTYWDRLKEFEIQVYEESVEADPFNDYQSAWKYYSNEN
ncbi:hypothetical protein [Blautia sp. MSJ-19]|uniref:hypothetical protein n=1 Tax=Blautia sp. MSJ-19 TaxID=2841517 RepID=UPI001C0F1D29|nr:hypothetical protein [Blautia sp. MSJ-19]MBU5482305.1 hypothetical protein [Blautia sp. MSJ-19]